jgi:hypothetical protein
MVQLLEDAGSSHGSMEEGLCVQDAAIQSLPNSPGVSVNHRFPDTDIDIDALSEASTSMPSIQRYNLQEKCMYIFLGCVLFLAMVYVLVNLTGF